MDRTGLQHELDSLRDGDALEMHAHKYPRELEGPLLLRKRVAVDGKGATVWSRRGPVVAAEVDGIVLRNLTIEVTGDRDDAVGSEACALVVKPGCKLKTEGVEVRGAVAGLAGEEGQWQYPTSLHLEKLAHHQDYEFLIRIVTPTKCTLRSEISGIDVDPVRLEPGRHEIHLRVDSSIPRDTLLHGPVFLCTPLLKRRITITGHVLVADGSWNPLSSQSPQILWEPKDWLAPPPAAVKLPLPAPPHANTPDDPAATPVQLAREQPNPATKAVPLPPAAPPRYPPPPLATPPSPPVTPPLPPPTPPSIPVTPAMFPSLTSTRIKVVTGPQLGGVFSSTGAASTGGAETGVHASARLGNAFGAGTAEPTSTNAPSEGGAHGAVRIEATRVFTRRRNFGGVDTVDWLFVNDRSRKMVEASSHHGQLETGYNPADSTCDLPSDEKVMVEKLKKYDEVTERRQWPVFVVALAEVEAPGVEAVVADRTKSKPLSPIFGGLLSNNSGTPPQVHKSEDSSAGDGVPSQPNTSKKTKKSSGLPPIFGGNSSGNG